MIDDILISLENVSVTFDSQVVLDDVSMSVSKGDFIAVTGPNGGGKTTLLRVMLKLLRPSRGRVTYYYDGSEVKSLRIGYLPQKNMIDHRFPISVEETVRSGLLQGYRGNGCSTSDRRLFDDVVEMTGISDLLPRAIGELSGGQLQRTLLARAVVSRPDVLVLDEPLSYVDKRFEHRIYDIIDQLNCATAIVLVSHEMSVISGMANRHLVVDHNIRVCNALTHYVPGCCRFDDDNVGHIHD